MFKSYFQIINIPGCKYKRIKCVSIRHCQIEISVLKNTVQLMHYRYPHHSVQSDDPETKGTLQKLSWVCSSRRDRAKLCSSCNSACKPDRRELMKEFRGLSQILWTHRAKVTICCCFSYRSAENRPTSQVKNRYQVSGPTKYIFRCHNA